MDDADRAADRMALAHDVALANARAALSAGAGIPPCGQCHNCGASVPDGHRWCDADCRDDWERRAGR